MSGAPNCSIDAMHEALLVKRALHALVDYPCLRPVMFHWKWLENFPAKWRIRIIVRLAKSSSPANEFAVVSSILDITEPIDVMVHLRLVKGASRESKMRRLFGLYNKMNNTYSIPDEFTELGVEYHERQAVKEQG